MFALELTLLTGRYAATQYNDRRKVEWPPHPARVFSALVAAHFAEEQPASRERAALQWLEALGPPEISASNLVDDDEGLGREVVTVFVPVNDTTVIGSFDEENERVLAAEAAEASAQAELAELEAAGKPKEAKQAERALAKANKEVVSIRSKVGAFVAKQIAKPDKVSKQDAARAESVLPSSRGRQPRTFPSIAPERSTIVLCWPAATPGEHAQMLDELSSRVVRVGHSASLVSMRVVETAPKPDLVPADASALKLRVVRSGQLERLEAAFARHRETEPRVMPASFQDYDAPERLRPSTPTTHFENSGWLVLEQSAGPMLPASRAPDLVRAVRGALMKFAAQPVPEVLSGHAADGSPSQSPHLAIVPLPFVGRQHADGTVKGIGLVLPRGVAAEQRAAVFYALRRWEEAAGGVAGSEVIAELSLRLGPVGVMGLRRSESLGGLYALSSLRWTGPASRWVTATPVALDRNPGNLRSREPAELRDALTEAERSLGDACARIGLPRPTRVEILPAAPLPGGLKAKMFAPFPREAGKTQRVLTHALLEFDQKVTGPVLLGAGRYQGLGLFCPLKDEDV